MPICKSTFGAFVRSRAPFHFSTSKTLVPFLYQTATIQQWKPAAQPIAHRNASSRASHDNDIPFENAEDVSPNIDNAAPEPEPSRKKTITGPERAAFEKLYQKARAEEIPRNELPFKHEVDQIADEWYEEEEDNKDSTSLDKVFDAVLSGTPTPSGAVSRQKKAKKPREDLQTLAESILRPGADVAKTKQKEEAAKQAENIRKLREDDKARVKAILERAETDRQLWGVLEREVLVPVRSMDLDGPNNSTKDQTASAAFDRKIRFPNFPAHLITAAQLLQEQFPSSPLLLTILPTLKSLGRSSYALGATTTLYNLLIRAVWVRYTNYDHINDLLTDMDNGGIEFNPDTLALLDDILSEHMAGRQGGLGSSMYAMFRMEHFTEGIKKVQIWRDVAARRLGAWTGRRTTYPRKIYSKKPIPTRLSGNQEISNGTMPGSSMEGQKEIVSLRDSGENPQEAPKDGLEALIQSSRVQSKTLV